MIKKAIILLFPLERQYKWTYWKTAFPSKISNSLILILWIFFDSRAICGYKKRVAPLLCFRAFSSNALHHYNYYQHHLIMFPWRKVECFMSSLYSSPSILLSCRPFSIFIVIFSTFPIIFSSAEDPGLLFLPSPCACLFYTYFKPSFSLGITNKISYSTWQSNVEAITWKYIWSSEQK